MRVDFSDTKSDFFFIQDLNKPLLFGFVLIYGVKSELALEYKHKLLNKLKNK